MCKKLDKETLQTNFKSIDGSLLGYVRLSKLLIEGYEIIQYDPYLEVLPQCKKYIIQDNGFNRVKSYSTDKPFVFDPEFLQNKTLRNFFFRFAWNLENSFSHRAKSLLPIREFLSIWDCKLTSDTSVKQIELEVIEAYKNGCYKRGDKPNSISKKLCACKKFLKYLRDTNLIECDDLSLDLMSSPEVSKIFNSENYSVESLLVVIRYIDSIILNTNRNNSKYLQLVHLKNIISIISISEIRVEGLLDMKLGDVYIEDGKYYKAKFRSKLIIENKNISKVCFNFFQDSITQSKEIRLKTNSETNEFIFLYLKRSRGYNCVISSSSLNELLKEICGLCNIKFLGMKGFRKLFNHQVTQFVKSVKDPNMKIGILTGHTPQVHFSNYINHNVRDHMQMVFDSYIGDMIPAGEILVTERNQEEKSKVKNGLGFCKSKDCVQSGKLDCLMCSTFLVTYQCKPFYENAIKEIDMRIVNEPLYHAKELLHLEKRLLVLYLTTLVEIHERKMETNGTI